MDGFQGGVGEMFFWVSPGHAYEAPSFCTAINEQWLGHEFYEHWGQAQAFAFSCYSSVWLFVIGFCIESRQFDTVV